MAELESIIANEGPTSKNIVVLFTGKVDPSTGESWCPDCVKADPIIEKCVLNIPAGNTFIVCVVGDRPTWKDPQCIFRTHEKTKLKGIPTLLKWGTSEFLNSDQCAKQDMVEMMFEELE